jgi:hypothetical protein
LYAEKGPVVDCGLLWQKMVTKVEGLAAEVEVFASGDSLSWLDE